MSDGCEPRMISSSIKFRSFRPETKLTSAFHHRGFLLLAYLLCGLLHELFHVGTAKWLGYPVEINLLGLALGRVTVISSMETASDLEHCFVQHAGWLGSLLLAIFVGWCVQAFPQSKWSRGCKMAAYVTLLEALSTDLLGWYPPKTVYFCGNFGVILLNDAWVKMDQGKTALDLLEKMISITMMRGAQTGGVVAWTQHHGKTAPVRVRVVNGKRTDLSKEMRKALNAKLCGGVFRAGPMDPSVRLLLGHTRFATSSKATLDGTHPHQWCDPQFRRVFPLDDDRIWTSKNPQPVHMKVSNFITHNGDLDFFKVNGRHAPLKAIQDWLVEATNFPMPALVDSATIAGLVDIIRCAGCFALSIRYAHLLAMPTSKISVDTTLPHYMDYDRLSKVFEQTLLEFCKARTGANLKAIGKSMREEFSIEVVEKIKKTMTLEQTAFAEYAEETPTVDELTEEFEQRAIKKRATLLKLVQNSVDAFFDNDLFMTTRLFMKSAVGSFGVMVTSSLDSHRQICIAARGQPMSIAFYPDKGIVLYGSELAAVKAGLQFDQPGGNLSFDSKHSAAGANLVSEKISQATCRYDLDDLNGETVLIDWSSGTAEIQSHEEVRSLKKNIRSRVTPLKRNEFLLPLTPDCDDPIGEDIASIPKALDHIQQQWKEGGLNRLTAWNLGRKLRERLEKRAAGRSESSVDVLLTGCEVSLWLAEQMASDLSKSFPKLAVQATSSNKLLGLMGQELSVPAVNFPMSEKVPDLKNTIVIIVSHSGGTFAPLAVSNLLQSVTENIFVVSSEWDSQIGKQLRALYQTDKDMFGSRIFTTDIGIRPAEPCSLSVAATHQLLTQIFEYFCLVILSSQTLRDLTGAIVTEPDLRILERCNQDNILALERIVGKDTEGREIRTEVHAQLKEAGNLWSDHVLENARAYIMSFLYIVGTVTSGYPLITGIAIAVGLVDDSWAFYLTRFFDGLIYFFLPQINITIIRLFQRRNLIHRMTGRTVVVGDIPWVSQSVEAFLSKIFARSYSIAGLNVLSGNPSDHLVHRHTHRIVRGSLLVCGRPDGRLTALTSAECAVNLSVNQASSIQSLGGNCESVTIGHNPAKLGLTKMDIELNTVRPNFLCEQILDVMEDEHLRKQQALKRKQDGLNYDEPSHVEKLWIRFKRWLGDPSFLDFNKSEDNMGLDRSSHGLKGAYLGMRERASQRRLVSSNISEGTGSQTGKGDAAASGMNSTADLDIPLDEVVEESREQAILAAMIAERQKTSELRQIFDELDADGSGLIDLEEFISGYQRVHGGLNRDEIAMIFHEADTDGNGELDYEEFANALNLQGLEVIRRLHHASQRNEQGLLEVKPSSEAYFGAEFHANSPPGINSFAQAQSQHFSMELYEARVASLQRFVAMCVMFHQMGKKVADFFPKYSLGLFSYKMERTHSIMRIATTASPISGDAVREQMQLLRTRARFNNASSVILDFWKRHQKQRLDLLKKQFLDRQGLMKDLSARSMKLSERSLPASLNESPQAKECRKKAMQSFSSPTQAKNGSNEQLAEADLKKLVLDLSLSRSLNAEGDTKDLKEA